MDKISILPLELSLIILSHLPLKSLLVFGATSRKNYERHILCVRRLRLAVFQKRIHSVVSFLQAGWANPDQISESGDVKSSDTQPSMHIVNIIQPRLPFTSTGSSSLDEKYDAKHSLKVLQRCSRPNLLMGQMVRNQNEVFAQFVNRYGRSLTELEFMAYDLDTQGAQALGLNCQDSLRHLALRFEHPHIRDGFTKPAMWFKPAPGSTAWNTLIEIGPQYKPRGKITGLETLTMERAGITPWQLSMLVRNNPNLKTLKLRTCSGAQPEFLDWLGGIDEGSDSEGESMRDDCELAPGAQLEVLWLENCQQVLDRTVEKFDKLPDEICDFGLEWVRGLTNLKSLSFSECACLSPEHVDRANKTIWRIPEVILPHSSPFADSILEVDPMFRRI
ncbi:hypothetical protein SI65_09208 [Aspergillus cristatus]|uniref:F-box domain-containing protein n=1 Tax=Aspergillus cristatus TaxID=573508 RepID=A0A1E3B2V6_ASPCR|nr:hypothetical protein SI65_09208 [Aspergillus cristatus]